MPQKWVPLQQGDCIQIIAPASKTLNAEQELKQGKTFLEEWGLRVKISDTIFGESKEFPNLANSDEQRYHDLKDALFDANVKAIWCIRGGYGSIRLMEQLKKLTPPAVAKLVIGFSDVTLLLIFLRQRWRWNNIHGPALVQAAHEKVIDENIIRLRQLMFGEIAETLIDDLIPMNNRAEDNFIIKSEVIGGNLTLISRTFGWKKLDRIDVKNKILVMEDCNEPFRKVDGILQQMELANYFTNTHKPAAVIIGDFSIASQHEQSQVNNALLDFALKLDKIDVPVFRCYGIGHQEKNHPLPIGPQAILSTGKSPSLLIKSGAKVQPS